MHIHQKVQFGAFVIGVFLLVFTLRYWDQKAINYQNHQYNVVLTSHDASQVRQVANDIRIAMSTGNDIFWEDLNFTPSDLDQAERVSLSIIQSEHDLAALKKLTE